MIVRIITESKVYPRVGGGTLLDVDTSGSTEGLSPRGRGNQRGEHGAARLDGSIPAWAGEPRAAVG